MTTTVSAKNAVSASSFINSIGINGDADAQTATQLAYLGIDHLRAGVTSAANLLAAGADGAKIDVLTPWFLHAISSSDLETMLQEINGAASVIEAVEGPNEVNKDPDVYDGLSGAAGVEAEQKELYALVKSDTSLNNSTKTTAVYDFTVLPGTAQGAYSGMYNYADYNNVHAYGNAGAQPSWILPTVTSNSSIAGTKPVIVTETGADTLAGSGVDQATEARFDIDALLDDFQLGIKITYLYDLNDWDTGSSVGDFSAYYGLYNVDGTIKLAGTAIHNMTSLLGDSASPASFTPGTLTYGLSGMAYYGNSELFQVSSTTFDLALWNETTDWNATTNSEIAIPTNNVTIQLAQTFAEISVYDPLVSSSPIETFYNTSSITVQLNVDPLFIEFNQSSAPVIAAPKSLTMIIGQAEGIAGVSLSEVGAVTGEIFTVTLTDSHGLLSASGTGVSGSGTDKLIVTGSLAQVNAALATLTDNSEGASDTITIVATDSDGGQATAQQITITSSNTSTVSVVGADPPGSAGQSVSATANTAGMTANTSSARGGIGSNGSGSQAGGAGGSATAVAATVLKGATVTATATATGGTGGSSSGSGAAGSGGRVSGATATASGQVATATATSTGGQGGNRTSPGVAAVGGSVSATTATATGVSAATAIVQQTGGNGGAGRNGATGGAGAASSVVNAVSGSTNDGKLLLSQTAIGGAGGASDTGTGGNGGWALSTLVFNDTQSPTPSAAITATITALGGTGGTGTTGGNAGYANASSTITGTGAVTVTTTATDGSATAGGKQTAAATAESVATGTQVNDTATANGGISPTTAEMAYANVQATGTSGTITANAQTAVTAGHLLVSEAATAAAGVHGTAGVVAQAAMAASPPWFGVQAEASIDGLPSTAALAPIRAAAPNTSAVFGAGTSVLAVGEVGGEHSAAKTGTETSTGSTDITLDRLQLTGTPDLFLSFYKAVGSSSGISNVSLDITANGSTLLAQSFSSAATATAWLTDHPLDLGSLATGALATSSTLDLHVGLAVTTTTGGTGLSTGFLIGTAPASTHWPLT